MARALTAAASSVPVGANVRHIRVHVRSKVAQCDQRIGLRMIHKGHSAERCIVRDEKFILGHLSKSNDRWAIDVELADGSMPLSDDETVGSRIIDGAARARHHCELLRTELLLASESAVD